MRNFEHDRYILENVGDAEAEQVRVSAHESLYLDSPPVQDVKPGEPLSFMAAPSLATSDSTVTVTWQSGSEQETWRYPLPPRQKA